MNDSAKLHIIARPSSGTNGHVDVLAIIALENVAQRGDQPTFSVKISAKPFEKTHKQLSIAYNSETLKSESTKIPTKLQHQALMNKLPLLNLLVLEQKEAAESDGVHCAQETHLQKRPKLQIDTIAYIAQDRGRQ